MEQSFGTAKAVLSFLEWVGWGCLVLGGVVVLIAISDGRGFISAIAIAPLLAAGLVLIVTVQIGHAQIATAENTGRLVQQFEQIVKGLPRSDSLTAARQQGGVRLAPQAGQSGGLVKVYKKRSIWRGADGVYQVDGVPFEHVMAAEKAIDLGQV